MQQVINGSMLVGFLRMLRQVDSRVFILTEGPEDLVILEPHLDPAESFIYPGSGKSSVLDAAQEIEDEQLELMYCVIDRDCDSALGRDKYPQPCCVSDSYDLAMDVFRSSPDILERMAMSHSDRVELSRYLTQRRAGSLFELVLDIVSTLSLLRVASKSHAFALKLSDFPSRESLEAFENDETPDAIVDLACKRTPGAASTQVVKAAWEKQQTSISNVALITNSHDVLNMVAEIARTRAGASIGRKALARSVLGAVNCAALARTTILQELTARASAHGRSIWTCVT